MTKEQAAIQISQSIYEQAEDAAFQAQAFRRCEHIWEQVDHEIHQCVLCGDTCDLRNWLDRY